MSASQVGRLSTEMNTPEMNPRMTVTNGPTADAESAVVVDARQCDAERAHGRRADDEVDDERADRAALDVDVVRGRADRDQHDGHDRTHHDTAGSARRGTPTAACGVPR